MRLHLRDRWAPEQLNMVVIVVLMGLFALGILYAGASLRGEPITAQLAVPSSSF
jgi:hypothetical protein